MKILAIIIFLAMGYTTQSVYATNPNELLKRKFPVSNSSIRTHKYAGISSRKSAFSKYNPVTLFFNGSMYIYQRAVSEQISAECTFTPSCSEFSKSLIRKYGLVKGVFLTADRLTRCDGHADAEYPSSWIDRQTNKLTDQIDMYQWRNNF